MIYILEGQELHGQFKTSDGTTYPGNWCELSTSEELTAIGIISLTEVWPELAEGQEYSSTYIDDYAKLTRTYNIVDIPQL